MLMTMPMPGVVQKLLLYFCTDLLAKNDPGFSEKVLQSCGLMDHNISSFHSGEQKIVDQVIMLQTSKKVEGHKTWWLFDCSFVQS